MQSPCAAAPTSSAPLVHETQAAAFQHRPHYMTTTWANHRPRSRSTRRNRSPSRSIAANPACISSIVPSIACASLIPCPSPFALTISRTISVSSFPAIGDTVAVTGHPHCIRYYVVTYLCVHGVHRQGGVGCLHGVHGVHRQGYLRGSFLAHGVHGVHRRCS